MWYELFEELASVFEGDREIEVQAQRELLSAASVAGKTDTGQTKPVGMPESIVEVMAASDAHPICRLIGQLPVKWTPPQTSSDPLYVKHSLAKAHVELMGPTGLVPSDSIRVGLYGMTPGAEYGVRTHPAEEIYIMLAGQVDWMRGNDAYLPHGAGDRSYHPSMLPHANRTGDKAFMSVYVWYGDISTDQYAYSGVPAS